MLVNEYNRRWKVGDGLQLAGGGHRRRTSFSAGVGCLQGTPMICGEEEYMYRHDYAAARCGGEDSGW